MTGVETTEQLLAEAWATNKELHRRVQAVESEHAQNRVKAWSRSKERWLRYYRWKFEQASALRISRQTLELNLSRSQGRESTLESHLEAIIRAYDANSGNEPSVSVLARAIDEARLALSQEPTP